MNAGALLDSLTVFSARESPPVLGLTLDAALRAAAGRATVRVLVNGNPGLAAALRAQAARWPGLDIESLPRADKASAWNHALQASWRGEARMFFCDGYVHLAPDAIAALSTAVAARPGALAGSGVPAAGRSARRLRAAMLADGGLHGNFCCLTAPAVQAIRTRGLRLPAGLYRGEALWRALCCYAFDPARHAWRSDRVVVATDATWRFPPLRAWHPADWRALWRRRLRQAQGDLENLATRDHLSLRRLPPEVLPPTARALVEAWGERDPAGLQRALAVDWRRRVAWQRLQRD